MSDAARGAVFRFEELVQQDILKVVPEISEIWIRWVGSGSEARGRDVPDVHFVGTISPSIMQKCAMIADAAARRDTAVTRLGEVGFYMTEGPSPGDLKSKPSLVWKRRVTLY